MGIRTIAFVVVLAASAPTAAGDNLTRDAAIGGGIGGALGGAVGAEVGGRKGAIIGSGVGAAVGTAVATEGHDDHHDHHHDGGVVPDSLEIHAHAGHPVGHDRGRHCPPGQAKKGRC